MPDVMQFIKDQTQWSKLQVMLLMRIKQVTIFLSLLPMQRDLETIVLPFARSKGAQEFGAIGTCWGSYMVIRESSYPEVRKTVRHYVKQAPKHGK